MDKSLIDINDDGAVDYKDVLILLGVSLVGYFAWSFIIKSVKGAK